METSLLLLLLLLILQFLLSLLYLFLFKKNSQMFSISLACDPLRTSKYHHLVNIYILMLFSFPEQESSLNRTAT